MGYILLAFVIVCTIAEILIGIKRGIAFTGIRLLLCALGTVVAVLLSGEITSSVALIVAKRFDLGGATLSEVMKSFLGRTALAKVSDSLSVPFAAWTLSAMIPVVFSVLFIVMKFLTWLIFIVVKTILTKSKCAEVFAQKKIVSKVTGGIVGGLIGIYACALVLSPISCLVGTVEESGASESLFNILSMVGVGSGLSKSAKEQTLLQLAEKLDIGAIEVYASEEGTDGPSSVVFAGTLGSDNAIKDIYDSLAKAPSTTLSTIVGAQTLAGGIYFSNSEVEAEAVGGEGETYSFPEAIQEILGVADKVDETLTLVQKGNGINPQLISNVREIVDYALDSPILSDKEKLAIVNASVDVVQKYVQKAIGIGEVRLFSEYDDMDSLRSDIEAVLDIAEVISKLSVPKEGNASGTEGSSSDIIASALSGNVDVGAILGDSEMRHDLIHSTLMLNNGTDTVANLVNESVTKNYGEEYGDLIDKEAFSKADESEIIDLVDTAAELADYIGRHDLNPDEIDDIKNTLDTIAESGLLNENALEDIKARIK